MRARFERFQDCIARRVAYALPQNVVRWAVIRAWSFASAGPWSTIGPMTIYAHQVLDRWTLFSEGESMRTAPWKWRWPKGPALG